VALSIGGRLAIMLDAWKVCGYLGVCSLFSSAGKGWWCNGEQSLQAQQEGRKTAINKMTTKIIIND
jgi:hypothetical protein